MKMLASGSAVLLMIVLLSAAWAPASIAKEPLLAAQFDGQPQLFSWLGYKNSNVFDDQVLAFFATHSGAVVLHGPLQATHGGPSLAEVVAGFHELAPRTPVLLYLNASRLYTMDGKIRNDGRAASSV